MTQQKESVVTPERFAQGKTWTEWMEHVVQRNKDKFQYNYDETHVSAEDAAALRALSERDGGPAKVLVLGEDWCPDVFRGLPVLVRMAEAARVPAFSAATTSTSPASSEERRHHRSPPVLHEGPPHITHWIGASEAGRSSTR
jgi:hypothetical protein